MKRIDLIRQLEAFGCILVRHGGNHDWFAIRKQASHRRYRVTAK